MISYPEPVFFDDSGKRWGLVRRLAMALVFAFSVLGALLSFTLTALPSSRLTLGGPVYHHGFVYVPGLLESREKAARSFLARRSRDALMEHIKAEHAKSGKKAGTPKPYSTVIGFYANWDPAGYVSLREHIDSMTYVMPSWLGLPARKPSGPGRKSFVSRYDPRGYDPQVVKLAAAHHIPLIPMIDNAEQGAFHWDRLRLLLSSRKAQYRLATDLRDYLVSRHFAGINIDFELSYDKTKMTHAQRAETAHLVKEELPRFLAMLRRAFAPAHLLVTEDLPPTHPDLDYDALNDVNDFVVIMLYDQHYLTGNPGPIASQQWVEAVAEKVFSKMDSPKVVLGIGNYCYDWPVRHYQSGEVLRTDDGEIAFAGPAAEASLGSAWRAAQESKALLRMDEADLNPYFTYVDEEGQDHIVYILDAVTAYNQIAALKGYEPRGAALWCLGSEDPSLWSFFSEGKLDRPTIPAALERVVFKSEVSNDLEGEGEILEIIVAPKEGRRQLVRNEDGLIVSEKYSQYPSPYILGRFGSLPKALALTFDDGPDPVYTPGILRILKANKVPATFFIVGRNAEQYSQAVRSCWESGCEIGNHTFTHPHIGAVSRLRAELELNATQRLIESITGHSTRLFRPPYGEGADTNPGAAEIHLLREVQDLGYVTVGMNIDPGDYERPGADVIVQRVEKQVGKGHIILLHDSGGDRSQTVAALPSIIRNLKSRGYRFVTVSELLGKKGTAKLFPVVTKSQDRLAGFDRVVFEGGLATDRLLRVLFLVCILLGVARVVFVGALALLQARRPGVVASTDFSPPVTVIIPAYNESKVICRTIQSVLESDYPHLRMIVVDDGSTDNTSDVVTATFASEPRVTFLRKENGGKPSALNLGLSEADTEIIICLDADTLFAPDTITRLVPHFADPKVGAVAGNVKVGNRTNPLTVWQSVEYVTSQNFDRRAYAMLNSVAVVPGAVGAWRKAAVMRAGGYHTDTLAEDTDLTFRIRLQGYHIRTENSALAYTEAPDSVSSLARQRFRWAFGTLQALWKHRKALFKPRYGAFSLFVMPAMWVYNIFFQALSPIVDVLVVLSLVHHQFGLVIFYYAAFFALDFLGALLAFALDRENPVQLSWLFWQRFFYRQFMYYIILKSIVAALRGGIVGWGKLQRKANVAAVGL